MMIEYHKVGDYQIPNLKLEESADDFRLGKYGALRLNYLKQNKRFEYKKLMYQNQLTKHLMSVQNKAQDMYDKLINEYKEKEHITEELKAQDQMKWVGLMNNVSNAVDEIILNEVIYK